MKRSVSRRTLLELLGAAGVSTAVGATATVSGDTASESPSRGVTPLTKAPLGPGFDASGAFASLSVIGYLLKRRLESGTTPERDEQNN